MGQQLKIFVSILAILVMAVSPVTAAVYTVDNAHSSIGFEVSHMTISIVKGEFTDYTGTVTYEPDNPEATRAEAVIQAASIDTRNAKRDEHLKSPDFFNVEANPLVSFMSRRVVDEGDFLVLVGDLTINGVTREIEMPVSVSGPVTSPYGASVIGLSGETVIDRQDFNVSWNKTLDQGGLVVGNDVKIVVNIEASVK